MIACNNVYHLVGAKSTKKILGPKFGPKGTKSGLKLGVLHFLKFGSVVFLEIASSDSLQQCRTSSRGKTHEKNLGNQIWVKKGQNQAEN